MSTLLRTLSLLLLATLFACLPPDRPDAQQQQLPHTSEDLDRYHTSTLLTNLPQHDTVYIPIYSDIYSETKDVKFNLTATLSIRNTSLVDTLYLGDIDYYDTDGALVRQYIPSQNLALQPMQSIEYVIEENDIAGGTGANFIITWAARHAQVYPVFQGVMISTHGQQGISFLTEGVSISRRAAPAPTTIPTDTSTL